MSFFRNIIFINMLCLSTHWGSAASEADVSNTETSDDDDDSMSSAGSLPDDPEKAQVLEKLTAELNAERARRRELTYNLWIEKQEARLKKMREENDARAAKLAKLQQVQAPSSARSRSLASVIPPRVLEFEMPLGYSGAYPHTIASAASAAASPMMSAEGENPTFNSALGLHLHHSLNPAFTLNPLNYAPLPIPLADASVINGLLSRFSPFSALTQSANFFSKKWAIVGPQGIITPIKIGEVPLGDADYQMLFVKPKKWFQAVNVGSNVIVPFLEAELNLIARDLRASKALRVNFIKWTEGEGTLPNQIGLLILVDGIYFLYCPKEKKAYRFVDLPQQAPLEFSLLSAVGRGSSSSGSQPPLRAASASPASDFKTYIKTKVEPFALRKFASERTCRIRLRTKGEGWAMGWKAFKMNLIGTNEFSHLLQNTSMNAMALDVSQIAEWDKRAKDRVREENVRYPLGLPKAFDSMFRKIAENFPKSNLRDLDAKIYLKLANSENPDDQHLAVLLSNADFFESSCLRDSVLIYVFGGPNFAKSQYGLLKLDE